jgi:hypothetical protein
MSVETEFAAVVTSRHRQLRLTGHGLRAASPAPGNPAPPHRPETAHDLPVHPPRLAACEFDVNDMAAMGRAAGFQPTVLLTEAATSVALLGLLAHCAGLQGGDRLLISLAGHGAQVPDRNGDEADGLDETWVLYDRMVLDDELYTALLRLQPGVRVVLVPDSCHSGTVDRAVPSRRPRAMDARLAADVYARHDRTYGIARAQSVGAGPDDARCEGLLLAACQDSQVALDGDRNGLFTGTLKGVWDNGRFRGSYLDAMRAALPGAQPGGTR